MKKQRSLLLILFLCLFSLVKNPAGQQEPFELLKEIKSPGELLLPFIPKQYTVPVSLSGAIAEEMNATLKKLDLPEPQYLEVHKRQGRFQLILANEDYTDDTRGLLSGIMNPVEITETVLKSIIKYRDEKLLKKIIAETRIGIQDTVHNGMEMKRICFKPAGDFFDYSYEDMGSYIQEKWLSEMVLIFDPNTMLAHEISIVKHTRIYSAHQQEKPPSSSFSQKYSIEYDSINNAVVPIKLTLFIDTSASLSLSATYRIESQHVLFDKRSICYNPASDTPSCVEIKYGDYSLNTIMPEYNYKAKHKRSVKKLKKAAALSIKASDALSDGYIQRAIRIMRLIVDNYPGTPQAIEAKKMLTGLPGGL